MNMRFSDAEVSAVGAFLVGELERLDPKLYEPMADFTWSRDIDVRNDVTIADEVSSFIYEMEAGGVGGTGPGKKSWITGQDTTMPRPSIKSTKVMTPVTPWGEEVSYTILELAKAQKAGRPIDTLKFNAMRRKWQLDTDAQCYVGDTEVGVPGMLNNTSLTSTNVGAITSSTSAADILEMFNTAIKANWANTNYVRLPHDILVSPAVMSLMSTMQLPNTNSSVLKYVLENNAAKLQGVDLKIRACKWLADTNYFANDKMLVYTKDEDLIRLPKVELQSVPVQYRGLQVAVPYYGALGGVEFVRPETCTYAVFAS